LWDYTGYNYNVSGFNPGGVGVYNVHNSVGYGVTLNSITSNTINVANGASVYGNEVASIFLDAVANSSATNSLVTVNVTGNSVANNGNLDGDYNGILLNAYSAADGIATASVDHNTITNHGFITSNGDYDNSRLTSNGITLSAISRNGDISTATVGDNVITNHATIMPYHTGIQLYAKAYGANIATASIERNVITNNGVINTSAGTDDGYTDGIALNAYATMATNANASITSNVITNNGTINAGFYYNYTGRTGILLQAGAGFSGNAIAVVSDNVITNNGRLTAYDYGVLLKADAYMTTNANASVVGNTITNSGKAVIQVFDSPYDDSQDAIRLKAAANGDSAVALVDNNAITNAGKIYANHDGIYVTSRADGGNAIATTSRNVITNSGLIDVGSHGVHLAAYSYANLTASAVSNLNNNVITNTVTGVINADNQSVKMRAMSYAYGGAETISTAASDISHNIVVNAGVMKSTYDSAIDFKALADGESSQNSGIDYHHPGWGFGSDANGSSIATNDANQISNTGVLTALHGNAINLYAKSINYSHTSSDSNGEDSTWQDVSSVSISSAIAANTGNIISNGGTITADGNGVVLTAFARSETNAHVDLSDSYWSDIDPTVRAYSSAIANNNGNTIVNSGKITAGGDGINLYSHSYAKSNANTDSYYVTNWWWDGGWGLSGTHTIHDNSISNATSQINNNNIVNNFFIIQ
jgi:hypothetical protein